MTKSESPLARLFKVEQGEDGLASCAYCRDRFPQQLLTTDHVKARANGGRNARRNRVLACEPCNKMKGAQPEAVFRAWLESEEGRIWVLFGPARNASVKKLRKWISAWKDLHEVLEHRLYGC